MKNNPNPNIIVTKVKPYPIAGTITRKNGLPPVSIQILRLVPLGFQVDMESLAFSVGELCVLEMTIPILHFHIIEDVKVIKTMDRFKDPKATQKSYIVEMHFTNLKQENEKKIKDFMKAINQK